MKYPRLIASLCFGFLITTLSTQAADEQLDQGMVNPGYHEQPPWFKASFLDIREDINEATENNQRLMLYFYQDGCPYCAKLLRDNLGNPSIAQATQQHFDVIAINLWGDREVVDFAGNITTEKQLAEALRVQYTPTLLLLNESAEVVLRINGYFAPHKFRAAVDFVGGKHEKQQDFRTFYASANPQPASGTLHQLADSLPMPLHLADNRAQSHRPLLVIFEQKICPDCDELHQDILRRPQIAHALTNLDIAVVDMWSKELIQTPEGHTMPLTDWAKALGIHHTPSWVFFDTQGKAVFRIEAYVKSFHIHGAIDYVVSQAYHAQPNFQRFLQHRTDTLHARGFNINLMD